VAGRPAAASERKRVQVVRGDPRTPRRTGLHKRL